jgi:hypothetical protein
MATSSQSRYCLFEAVASDERTIPAGQIEPCLGCILLTYQGQAVVRDLGGIAELASGSCPNLPTDTHSILPVDNCV